MDIKLQALKKGFFKHNRNPSLIKEYTLLNYLKFSKSRTRLIREIAYCLTTEVDNRFNREVWRIAYHSSTITDWKYKLVYSNKKAYQSLNDLNIIDISILNNPNDREILYTTYPWFKDDLLLELKLISQHGQQIDL